MSLLAVSDLSVSIGATPILKRVTFSVESGRVLGVIGESGAGKSMTALAIMRLLPAGARAGGTVALAGGDLLERSERQMCGIRGRDIGMVFQEPATALDPLKTIGDQVAETILVHTGASRRDALDEADRALDRAGLPRELFPRDRLPHELSGGQRQRVVIASAIALRPKLLIADEPTTALDVTTQAHVLELFRRLVDEDGMGLIFITHDLAVVAGLADEVAVMRAGEIVDGGRTAEVFRALTHPYTRQLFEASSHVPRRDPSLPGGAAILEVDGVVRDYRLPPRRAFGPAGAFRAIDGVSFSIGRGENVGLVGESGSGKSTLARAILALDPVQGGSIRIDGVALADRDLGARRKVQAVFQDPYGSFDPRQRVETLVTEPFHLLGPDAPQGAERRRRAEASLETVGLVPADCDKYIHEFSGGQRQRIAIARALIIEPKLIVLDEAVSALDVSIRAQILDLLAELSDRLEISYLFISHDLSVVRAITDRVLVMKAGKIVESGPTQSVFDSPQHPYTRELTAAAPNLERALAR
jgi:peptide/nickel transport system ATP-binding protein